MAERTSCCGLGTSYGWWDHFIAVGLRLGTPLCSPHECSYCGVAVEDLTTHSLSCHRSEGRHPRYAAVNDVIHRALASAKDPFWLEPSGLFRFHGKCPDRCSILPWKSRKMLVWDATCPDTYTPSHVSVATKEAGPWQRKLSILRVPCTLPRKSAITLSFLPWKRLVCLVRQHLALSGTWAMPASDNKGGTQQGVPPPKNRHCSTEGECCSSAWDRREAGRSL